MARFKFRYETVLRQRRNVEDQRQRELAQHLRGKMILENQLRQMQQTIRDSKQQMGTGLVGTVDLAGIGRIAQYSAQVRVRGQQIAVQLAQREKQIIEARQRLLEATRQRKALDILRDKHYRRWVAEQNRRETVELDDLTNQRYARRLAMEASR